MAPHYRFKLVLTENSKSSANNNLFAGHKVLIVNTQYFKHLTWSQNAQRRILCVGASRF